MENIDTLDPPNLKSFSIKVTEEIQPRFLLTFLRTHIKNQNFLLNSSTHFYYYFHEPTLQYEVLVFDRLQKNSFPTVFALSSYEKTKDTRVFLLQDSFCLFIKDQLVMFKKVDRVLEQDIKEYIEQVYGILVEEFISLDSKQLQKLALEYEKGQLKKDKKKIYPFQEEKSFVYFYSFFLVVSIIFLLSLYEIYSNKLEKQTKLSSVKNNQQQQWENKLLSHYKEHKDQAPMENLLPVFKILNSLEIKIVQLEYRNKKVRMLVKHSQKEALLQLLANEKIKLQTKAIYFDKSFQQHLMEISFVF